MKILNLFALLCLLLYSCSKKSTPSSAPMQIQVSGLSSKTSLSLVVTDNSYGSQNIVLSISNQFGDQTYSTQPVNPGDQLYITFSTNIQDDQVGDGVGELKFFFKGEQMGGTGIAQGIIPGNIHETVPQP